MSQEENRKGRVTAFVTRSRFRTIWHEAWAKFTFLIARGGIDESRARALSFLHHAYIVVLPQPGESNGWRTSSDLLFISAFAGDWEDYLAGFRLVTPRLMNLIWGQTEGWTKSPHVPNFLEHVRCRQHPVATFFNAYGNADVRDIRNALRVREAWDRIAGDLSTASDQQLQSAYAELMFETF
jgi:hypothetical protein